MDTVWALALIAVCGTAAFLGSWTGTSLSERYYQRKQDNKLYGTVFGGIGDESKVQPIGEELLTPEEYSARGSSDQECETPEEPPVAPPRATGTGWTDNHAAGPWPPPMEVKHLPGDLGGKR